MAIKCPKCNTDNSDTQKFCGECATPLQPSEDIEVTETIETPKEELTRGATLANRYEIIEELGKGGMGRVYRVEDKKTKEELALKIIKPEISSDKKTIERFSNEIKLAHKISHRNVCRMFHLGEEKGTHFITMEYVPGEDLRSSIRRFGQLPIGKSISIVKQICEGLAEAHRLGVVHRDLKSSNVMIDKEGNVRIMDFGIARSLEARGLTGEGVIIGTPEYMSPEQVEAKEVDYRSDIYSLGVILYEMVTGKLPFEGDTPLSIAMKHKGEMPIDPIELNVQIPKDLSQAIFKCMDKDREKRYQSADEFLSELSEIEKEIPTTARLLPKRRAEAKKVGKIKRKNLILYGGITTLMILIVLGGAYFFIGGGEETDSVAVFPFSIVGGDSEDQVFCQGLVETLTNKLTQLEQFQRSIWIVPARQVREFEITSPSKARRVFKANLAVKGSFKRIGDMVSLTLKLVDTKTQRELKSQPISDHIANISTFQEDAILKIMEMLEVELKPQIHRVLAAGGTTMPNAYKSYLQGCGYMQSYEEEAKLNSAISLFKQAIEQDPHYALAHDGLGKAYWQRYKLNKDSDWLEKAQSSCCRAIEISDLLASAHVSLGIIYIEKDQYKDAIKEFQKALILDPVNFNALSELALAYEKLGREENAEETYKKIVALKPNYWQGYSLLGYFYYIRGRNAEAAKMYLQSTELMTENTLDYNNLIAIYYLLGQNDSAIAMFEKSIAIKPNADAYSNMGVIYFMQRRYATPWSCMKKLLLWGERIMI